MPNGAPRRPMRRKSPAHCSMQCGRTSARTAYSTAQGESVAAGAGCVCQWSDTVARPCAAREREKRYVDWTAAVACPCAISIGLASCVV